MKPRAAAYQPSPATGSPSADRSAALARVRPCRHGKQRVRLGRAVADSPTRPVRRARCRRGLPCRRGPVWVLTLSVAVLLGGLFTVSAAAQPGNPAVPAPPAPVTAASPSPALPPCVGEDCIPQPATVAPPTNPALPAQPGDTGQGRADCGITNIGGCVTNAINDFFRGVVTDALNPLLDLLSQTLLTTPPPGSLPRIGELWNQSWQIMLACYGLLVMAAGLLVMAYESLQARYSIKEIAPRLVVGFLAGALSLFIATKAIELANALAQAFMSGGLDANSAGEQLKNLALGSLNGGIFVIFVGLFLAGMLIALLITYIVRVSLTVILIAGAPLALMFHALPQTEGIARWWWKAFGGCLAIQVVQSLALITAMRVLLAPGGFTFFGPTTTGVVNLLVALALMYILFKIPFWMLSSARVGGGRSLIGSLARAFVAYKTFGLLGGGGGGGGGRRPRSTGGNTSGGGNGGGETSDPYARVRTNADGQYLLPLKGVRHGRAAASRRPAAASTPATRRRSPQGRQLTLPLGDDWPENKPVLGRDGQYRLPLDVQRSPRSSSPHAGAQATTAGSRRRGGRQLELPIDPYKGNRPLRSGQYPLPLDGVRRVPRPPASTSRPSAAPSPTVRPRGTQLELPLDPYKGNRPTRSGQYPLPYEGVRRTATPPPASAQPRTPSNTPRKPRPPVGRQLRLPLDLPRNAPPRPPAQGGRK